jgi:hypothetical protein
VRSGLSFTSRFGLQPELHLRLLVALDCPASNYARSPSCAAVDRHELSKTESRQGIPVFSRTPRITVENWPQEWLEGCCNWIVDELSLDANAPPTSPDFARLTTNIELQLLQSDLCDSTQRNTGIPPPLLSYDAKKTALEGSPCLVEVVAIDEVGNSAFSLMNVRQARIDKADLAGLANAGAGEGQEGAEDDEGPIPKYPRSMLKLTLSDGTNTFKAMEFKRLPDLQLGETPLGYKVGSPLLDLLKYSVFRASHRCDLLSLRSCTSPRRDAVT